MNKFLFFLITVLFFAFVANVSAQLIVDATGRVNIGGGLAVSNNVQLVYSPSVLSVYRVPITFRVAGVLAGYTGSPGSENVSFGYGAFTNIRGNYNTATGTWALAVNTTGSYNTATGSYALTNNTTGNLNTAAGGLALSHNTTGSYNTAGGDYALYSNTTGDFNTAGGSWALYDNTTGSYNTASGDYALSHNTTGNFNTAVGAYVSVKETDLSNATAIGYLATATSSNQVKIGNGSVTSIGGFADWTNFSDKRAKKNIRTDVPGLVFINRLQPVTYNLDLDAVDGLLKIDQTKKSGRDEVEQPMSQELIALDKKAREAKEKQVQTGFVAQDVEEVAQSIGYDFSGVDVDETGIYGLRYAEFVVPLVKAVQELSEQNDRLQAQVNELTELVSGLLGEEPESGALRSKSAVEPASGLQDVAGSGVSLQQNIPNPFHQSTVIRYTLPPTGQQAQMVITGASGRVIRKIPLSASDGPGSITIEGGALAAGIYYYSLYIGNSLVDTKKMILTK